MSQTHGCNGDNTVLWKDLWLQGKPICDQLSVLFNLVVDKHSTVTYKMSHSLVYCRTGGGLTLIDVVSVVHCAGVIKWLLDECKGVKMKGFFFYKEGEWLYIVFCAVKNCFVQMKIIAGYTSNLG